MPAVKDEAIQEVVWAEVIRSPGLCKKFRLTESGGQAQESNRPKAALRRAGHVA
jgi:hypothetical protein